MKKNDFANIGDWLLKWGALIFFMIIFTICAITAGTLIDKHIWVVFVADVIFCFVFWVMLSTHRRNGYGRRTRLLAIILVILFVIIAITTFGVVLVTSEKVILNVIVFPTLVIMTIIQYITCRMRKDRLKRMKI